MNCSKCNRELSDGDLAGTDKIKCPGCGQTFRRINRRKELTAEDPTEIRKTPKLGLREAGVIVCGVPGGLIISLAVGAIVMVVVSAPIVGGAPRSEFAGADDNSDDNTEDNSLLDDSFSVDAFHSLLARERANRQSMRVP